MKRICVFGGRDWVRGDLLWADMATLYRKHDDLTLVLGGCPTGADDWARIWGMLQLGEDRVEMHLADWNEHGNAAGPIRNRVMAESGLDGAVGYPGGTGTMNMAKELQRVGIKVWWPRGGNPL